MTAISEPRSPVRPPLTNWLATRSAATTPTSARRRQLRESARGSSASGRKNASEIDQLVGLMPKPWIPRRP